MINMKIKGLEEVQKKYMSITVAADLNGNEVKEFLGKQGLAVERKARKLTPVDSGTLRRGWTTKWLGHGKVIVFNPVSYASHVNYGHKTKNGGYVSGRYMLDKAVMNRKDAYYEAARKFFMDSLKGGSK